MSTYKIGRGADNDIVVREGRGFDTVSAQHAELILDETGRYYLADRGSRNGTFVRRGGRWKRIRQEYVDGTDRILLGEFETSVVDLMRRLPATPGVKLGEQNGGGNRTGGGRRRTGGFAIPIQDRPKTARDDLPSGPVEFDPETGEIVKKRD